MPKKDEVITKLHQLQWHLDGVPRVRRLLANVPSFMIFDDHEVTDDWNITPRWAKQTRANALGRGGDPQRARRVHRVPELGQRPAGLSAGLDRPHRCST